VLGVVLGLLLVLREAAKRGPSKRLAGSSAGIANHSPAAGQAGSI
jgi:hypothetical protein